MWQCSQQLNVSKFLRKTLPERQPDVLHLTLSNTPAYATTSTQHLSMYIRKCEAICYCVYQETRRSIKDVLKLLRCSIEVFVSLLFMTLANYHCALALDYNGIFYS